METDQEKTYDFAGDNGSLIINGEERVVCVKSMKR